MKRFVELNHILEDGMMVYPGLPRPKIGAFLDHRASRSRYEGQAEFYLGKVEMVCNLSALPQIGFKFYAVPLRIVRGASFPVRAFGEVDEYNGRG